MVDGLWATLSWRGGEGSGVEWRRYCRQVGWTHSCNKLLHLGAHAARLEQYNWLISFWSGCHGSAPHAQETALGLTGTSATTLQGGQRMNGSLVGGVVDRAETTKAGVTVSSGGGCVVRLPSSTSPSPPNNLRLTRQRGPDDQR